MEQLDQAGEQGYKLISATYRWQGSYAAPIAILERDEAQREYAWFETTSKYPSTFDGFEENYAALSQRAKAGSPASEPKSRAGVLEIRSGPHR
jgi:hypothetical protein